MGQCYTFNSGADGAELLTTPKGGTGNGLEVMLDVQQDEYLPVWKDMGMGGVHGWAVEGSGKERRCCGVASLKHKLPCEKGLGRAGPSQEASGGAGPGPGRQP